ARDGDVALDPAAAVEHLRVGDLPDVARDAVVTQPLEQLGRSRPGDLELRERRLIEEAGGLPGGAVLRLDPGRPQLSGPAVRAQRLVAGGGVGLVPVDALPARLLAEGGAVGAMPFVGAGHAQRPPGAALVPRVADVVVGLIDLPGPLQRVGRRA